MSYPHRFLLQRTLNFHDHHIHPITNAHENLTILGTEGAPCGDAAGEREGAQCENSEGSRNSPLSCHQHIQAEVWT